MDYLTLNTEQLRALYQQKTNELTQALLLGNEWDELKAQREEVTRLAIALHRRLAESGTVTPADFQVRQSTDNAANMDEVSA